MDGSWIVWVYAGIILDGWRFWLFPFQPLFWCSFKRSNLEWCESRRGWRPIMPKARFCRDPFDGFLCCTARGQVDEGHHPNKSGFQKEQRRPGIISQTSGARRQWKHWNWNNSTSFDSCLLSNAILLAKLSLCYLPPIPNLAYFEPFLFRYDMVFKTNWNASKSWTWDFW